jgi:ADP-ribose pyrophosphatase YjhB (NUDIX family)
MTKTRLSCGIVVVYDWGAFGSTVLCVHNRHSYSLMDLIAYVHVSDMSRALSILQSLPQGEMKDILSGKIGEIYERIHGTRMPDVTAEKFRRLIEIYAASSTDEDEYKIDGISHHSDASDSASPPFASSGRGYWSPPKGKKCGKEDNVTAALREMEEETSLSRDDIRLLPCPPVTHQMVGRDGVKYKTFYYLAKYDGKPGSLIGRKMKKPTDTDGEKWIKMEDLSETIGTDLAEKIKRSYELAPSSHLIAAR